MSAPLIGLVGAKRAGKDTFAEGLVAHGWKRLAFADRLKAVAVATDPTVQARTFADGSVAPVGLAEVVSKHGFEQAKEVPEVRRFLQNLGVAVRDHLGPTAWIDPVLTAATHYRSPGFGSLGEAAPGIPVVVTDVRFPNEVDAILNSGGRIVKIVRPGQRQDDAHLSEALAWDETLIPWRTVVNRDTVQDLHWLAESIGHAAWVAA